MGIEKVYSKKPPSSAKQVFYVSDSIFYLNLLKYSKDFQEHNDFYKVLQKNENYFECNFISKSSAVKEHKNSKRLWMVAVIAHVKIGISCHFKKHQKIITKTKRALSQPKKIN